MAASMVARYIHIVEVAGSELVCSIKPKGGCRIR